MIQYNKGEYVSYAANGVCLIADIVVPDFDRNAKDPYYILKPTGDKATTVFISTKNDLLLSRMRRLLTKGEIDSLLTAVKDEAIEWVNDRKKRAEIFEEIIKNNDILEILRMIGCLYIKKEELSKRVGYKMLTFSDHDLLDRAEKLIENEFSFVLGISKDEVPAYIKKQINA